MSNKTLSRDEAWKLVRSAVAEVLAQPEEQIRLESRFLEDLGATSSERLRAELDYVGV